MKLNKYNKEMDLSNETGPDGFTSEISYFKNQH